VNINGFSGNPAVTINYVSVAKGTMKVSYKDIQYSGSRSYPMNARKE